MYKVGLLHSLQSLATTAGYTHLKSAFEDGLRLQGLTIQANSWGSGNTPNPPPLGQNDVFIWEQAAGGNYSQLDTLAGYIVNDATIDVTVTAGGLVASQALKKALSSSGANKKRVVYASGRTKGDDPDNEHLPYSSVGVYLETTRKSHNDLETRQRLIELLGIQRDIFQLVNSNSIVSNDEAKWPVSFLVATNNNADSGSEGAPNSLRQAFREAKDQGADALVVSGDPFFTHSRQTIVNLANGAATLPGGGTIKLPVCYPFREYVSSGGFVSHGPSLAAVYRQLGSWAGMLTKDPKRAPHSLPPARKIPVELVVNRTTGQGLVTDGKIRPRRLEVLMGRADAIV